MYPVFLLEFNNFNGYMQRILCITFFFISYTDPKWKLYILFLWIAVLLVYISLYDIRTIIEISSRITIMQFLSKPQVYLSVNAWKTCSLRCTCSGTGGSIIALKPTRILLQLSTDNKKLIYCYKTLAFSDGTSFIKYKKPSYWRTQGRFYGKWYRAPFWLLYRLCIILWAGTTVLRLLESMQDLVEHVWQRYVLIALHVNSPT